MNIRYPIYEGVYRILTAYMGRHFYFLMSFQSVFRGLRQGLAKENTAAKRG